MQQSLADLNMVDVLVNNRLTELFRDDLNKINGVNISIMFINDKVNAVIHTKPTQIVTLFNAPMFAIMGEDLMPNFIHRSGFLNPFYECKCKVVQHKPQGLISIFLEPVVDDPLAGFIKDKT